MRRFYKASLVFFFLCSSAFAAVAEDPFDNVYVGETTLSEVLRMEKSDLTTFCYNQLGEGKYAVFLLLLKDHPELRGGSELAVRSRAIIPAFIEESGGVSIPFKTLYDGLCRADPELKTDIENKLIFIWYLMKADIFLCRIPSRLLEWYNGDDESPHEE